MTRNRVEASQVEEIVLSIHVHIFDISERGLVGCDTVCTQCDPQVLGLVFVNKRTRAIYRPTH